jgi:plastocyanin
MAHGRSSGGGRCGRPGGSATGFAVGSRAFATWVTLAAVGALAAGAPCRAGELSVSVVDRSGRAVGDVVVTVAPVAATTPAAVPAPATAVMDQRQLAFVPRVLVVATGTSVEFPNNDTVSHQVYSFSPAKKFQLPLYKGARHPPVSFERPGLVVLGCNIHDEMVGYIYVTDAPLYGMTDPQGVLHLANVPAGDYRLVLWSPLIADPPATLTRTVHVAAPEAAVTRIELTRALRTRPEPRPRRGDWEY